MRHLRDAILILALTAVPALAQGTGPADPFSQGGPQGLPLGSTDPARQIYLQQQQQLEQQRARDAQMQEQQRIQQQQQQDQRRWLDRQRQLSTTEPPAPRQIQPPLSRRAAPSAGGTRIRSAPARPRAGQASPTTPRPRARSPR